MMASKNPIQPFLERQGVVVLDGGLATELEARGHDLADELWSARLLLDEPDVLRRVHLAYLEAGADCVASASYQATFEGFGRRGLGPIQVQELLGRSVELAVEARKRFWSRPESRSGRLRPLVAASIGPYGAYLADGSEYTGRYDLGEEGLYAFHRRRFGILAQSGADLVACESIPCLTEARVLAHLARETGAWAWISFTCRDGSHLSDGGTLVEAARELDAVERLVAIGVNCTAPRHLPSLLVEAGRATRKPLAAYPNSGEGWDAQRRCWTDSPEPVDLAAASVEWRAAGARLVGGCCRTGPADVRAIRERLLGDLVTA